jgi:hypothetical protein
VDRRVEPGEDEGKRGDTNALSVVEPGHDGRGERQQGGRVPQNKKAGPKAGFPI